MVSKAPFGGLRYMHQLMDEGSILCTGWIIIELLMDDLNDVCWSHIQCLLPYSAQAMYSCYCSFAGASSASDAVEVLLVYVVELDYVDDLCDSFLYVWGIVVLDHLITSGVGVLLGFGSKTFIGWMIHPMLVWINLKSAQEK